MFQEILVLMNKNQILQETLLLPRLIRCKLAVSWVSIDEVTLKGIKEVTPSNLFNGK